MNSQDFQDRLVQRGGHAGLAIDSSLGERLEAYYRLLALWNARINLTALPLDDPPPQTLDRLLIEPLVAARHVPREAVRMLDVGSGGGSPAIPLVLARQGLRLLMVESRTRKAVFLREAVRSLGIAADVVTSRVEALALEPARRHAHDLITMRAVRPSPELLTALERLIAPSGQLFLFARAGETSAPAVAPFRLTKTEPLVASLQSELLVLAPQ